MRQSYLRREFESETAMSSSPTSPAAMFNGRMRDVPASD